MISVKHLVSKKKKRFIEDGYDLDLAYIKPNIVAMGFPSENLEGVYRNHVDDVVKFLEDKHQGKYKVYNLCSERVYPPEKFANRVVRYGFDDHNAPPFELIEPCCEDMNQWLSADGNVAIVHCKAGKGRTGVMICAYLIYKGIYSSPDEAMKHYAAARTFNDKGVTIPSQIRYIRYFAHYRNKKLKYEPRTLLLDSITFVGIPTFNSGTCSPFFIVYQRKNQLHKSKTYEINKSGCEYKLQIPNALPICGDIKIDFFHKERIRKERMFVFWFNTFFLEQGMNQVSSKSSELKDGHEVHAFEYEKSELDKANKDKKDKLFPPGFRVRLHVKMSNKCSDTVMKNDSNSHPQNMLKVDSTDGPRTRVSPMLLPVHKSKVKMMSLPRSSKPSNSYQYENISNLPTSRSDGQLADQLSPADTKKRLMYEIRKTAGASPSGTLEKNKSQSLEVLTLGEEPLSDDDEEDDDLQWNFQCTATRL